MFEGKPGKLLAIVLIAAQVMLAGGLLWYRNVNLDGYGELPLSWQMYSSRP